MRIDIDKYFDKPELNQWLTKAMKSLKLESIEDFERKLNFDTNEGLVLKSNYEFDEYFELNTFPTSRKMARWCDEINPSDKAEGMDLFLSEDFKFDNKNWFDVSKYDLSKINTQSYFIDLSKVHNAGGSIVQELTYLQSYLNTYLENDIKNEIIINIACDSMFFCNISKLRVTRYLLEFYQEHFNIGDFKILSTPSKREMTIYDPWMNMLRGTASIASSFIGGADILSVTSFDALSESESDLGIRQSRNTFHILEKESFLSNVRDPGKGSYIIESLCNELLDLSYYAFKKLQAAGGLSQNLKKFSLEVELNSKKRKQYLAKNKVSIAGVNSYSNVEENFSIIDQSDDKDFPLRRTALDFELLRNKAQEKKMTTSVLVFGSEAKLSARIMFCTNYFEVLGSKVDVCFYSEDLEIQTDNIILCALDDDYDDFVSKLDLKDKNIFIAGNKFKKENAVNIYAGQDIYQTLSEVVGS